MRLWWPRSFEPAFLGAAEEAWADEYSQSQMAPARDVLDVASALGKALGEVVQRAVARWRVLVCGSHCGTTSASRPKPHFEQARLRMLATLDHVRDDLVRLLAAERALAA